MVFVVCYYELLGILRGIQNSKLLFWIFRNGLGIDRVLAAEIVIAIVGGQLYYTFPRLSMFCPGNFGDPLLLYITGYHYILTILTFT